MEDWVERALIRWPNVPALFGWLRLDRRGRWLIQGEPISRWQIIATINRNYSADEQGRWFFQNGPQRGYMQLEYAPFVLRVGDGDETLVTHTDQVVKVLTHVFMDEGGAVLFDTEHGAGLLIDDELDWALARMRAGGAPITEANLADALALPSGATTPLTLAIGEISMPIGRVDFDAAPSALGFVRDPKP